MEKEKGYLKSARLPSSRRVLGEFAGNLLQVLLARKRRYPGQQATLNGDLRFQVARLDGIED